jgi:hypothetical protein
MKVSPSKPKTTITMSTRDKKDVKAQFQWWKATKEQLAQQLISTAGFLKETQQYRYRQAATYARLYGNMSLFNFIGSNISKMDTGGNLPTDRPTFNLIQSATDTLVSRISQSRPSPVFLTDNGDYKERNLAKKLNNFVQGEFYSMKAYEKAAIMLRDALVEGTGVLHIYKTQDKKVGLERVLLTELLTDPNESIYGEPRSLYRFKLVDRSVLMEACPDFKKTIQGAEAAYPDNSSDSSKTVADMVMVVEGWHLPSGKDSGDGRHTLACSAGTIYDEEYTKDKFPFVFLHYSQRLLGFWAQGLAEQLTGTQIEINQLLHTISKAIRLVGVPRVFVEQGSKVVKAHNNNDVGTIITYSGTKPSYEVAPCVPQEMYAQLQRLIEYGYQQCGVSALQATSQKPAGLNSGEAIRSYDDISTDRFASLARKYDTVFIDLAYQVIDLAKDIAEEEGEYQTVYPGKNGTKAIPLPEMSILKNPFIIQCFNMSSLPRDPAGRMAKVTEMIQAGMISIKEGRRLLDYPDLEQMEILANASEERIFQILDEIIEDGKYTPPDTFMDLILAEELTSQYYNLYTQAKLEPEKKEQLINFFNQIQTIKKAAQPQPAPGAMPTPQAQPEQLPTSPLVPNAVQPGAAPAA